MSHEIIYTKTLKGGGMWSNVIGRGKTLRLTDLKGGANVGMLLYNEAHPIERYNMADTLKGQHIFYLTAPYCLHSDMGRLFCSITEDTHGWHDTVCGFSDEKIVKEKYGEKIYQEARNKFYRNAKENFLIELGKWGLGKKDLIPNLNFFSKVAADDEGNLAYDASQNTARAHIDLRFEMDSIVVLNTCQHPLDPNPEYAPKPIKIEVFKSEAPAADDSCRKSRPENERAFINTENYYALRT